MLDTARRVETPEGVELELRVAGPVVRSLAWALDVGLRLGIYVAAGVVLSLAGAVGIGVFLLLLFVGEWFYPVLFEVLGDGQTPGKRRFGLCVLHDDGTPVGWRASLVRNLVRFADFLPFFYGAGLAAMLASPDFKRLGDLAAGTVVVHVDPRPVGAEVPSYRPLSPPAPLELEEQQAIIAFAERASGWSEARAAELARMARPLVDETGRAAVWRLLSIANWLLGRRP